MGLRASDVSKKWIMERITGSIKTILKASGMPSIPALIFSYNMIMRTRRDTRRHA